MLLCLVGLTNGRVTATVLTGAAQPVFMAGKMMFLFFVSALTVVLGLGLLYFPKLAFGLDLFPGGSLGLWNEIQTVFWDPK